MPPRDDEMPEGTDQIINGAMETGAGAGASTGSTGSGFGGTGAGGTTPGGSADFAGGTGTAGGSGFIGGSGDDTGGFTSGGGSGDLGGGSGLGGSGGGFGSGGGGDFGGSGSSGGLGGGSGIGGGGLGGTGSGGFGTEATGSGGGTGGAAAGLKENAKSGVQTLKGQATDKVRSYALEGKDRATTALDDLSQVVNEAAQSIDERLGSQYGEYARRAATAVSGFADTVRGKDVDELFDDARGIVRKSPGVAIGAAAVIGFTLVRLVKAGMTDQTKDVEFQADPQLSGPSTSSGSTTSTQAPYVAPNTGV